MVKEVTRYLAMDNSVHDTKALAQKHETRLHLEAAMNRIPELPWVGMKEKSHFFANLYSLSGKGDVMAALRDYADACVDVYNDKHTERGV